MKSQTATESRCPTPLQLSYSRYVKEIVYKVEPTYDGHVKKFRLVNFDTYKILGYWNPSRFAPFDDKMFITGTLSYAYAYLINPLKTNILALDFDIDSMDTIMNAIEIFANEETVKEIDLAGSSFDEDAHVLRHHLYIGLNDTYSALNFYKLDIPGACKNFMRTVLSRNEIVIRVSKKFGQLKNNPVNTNPRWLMGWSRKDKDTWLSYTSEQLIAPSTTVDGPSSNGIRLNIRPHLRLRG
jgi:hypothetical protein